MCGSELLLVVGLISVTSETFVVCEVSQMSFLGLLSNLIFKFINGDPIHLRVERTVNWHRYIQACSDAEALEHNSRPAHTPWQHPHFL